MSIAQSILGVVESELERHGLTRAAVQRGSPLRRERQLRAFWQVLAAEEPQLASAKSVTVAAEVFDLETWQAVPAGRRVIASFTPPSGAVRWQDGDSRESPR